MASRSFSGTKPRVIVFADFGGFTHRIDYPNGHVPRSNRHSSQVELLTPQLQAKLDDWQRSFERDAWRDFTEAPGSMLWVAWDLKALQVCRLLKEHLQSSARVIYGKAHEDPFARYETMREILEDGSIRVLKRDAAANDWL